MDDRKLTIHQKLLTTISDTFDPTSTEYDSFLQHMQTHVPSGVLARNATLLGKLRAMATKGHLSPGNYSELKSVAKNSGNIEILKIIEDAEKKIMSLETVKGAETQTNVAKRRRHEGTTENASDGLSKQKEGLSYYDTEGKTGYLLILNSTLNRKGTENDVRKLKSFFQDKLKFDVDNPRELETQDLSTAQLDGALEDAKNRLNGISISKKYYCFVCAILSHGDENGIATADGNKSVEAIRKEFNNKAIPNFAGKPKIFFVQACRGDVGQDTVDADDEADEYMPDTREDDDESDQIIHVPTDADTLIAYSTTPGYLSFRKPTVGSWFITKCLEVFEEKYMNLHLEDMLITVKERVIGMATGEMKRQMPCVWSSLTRRLEWRVQES